MNLLKTALRKNGEHTVITEQPIAAGQTVGSLEILGYTAIADRFTIQCAADRHVVVAEPFAFLNHSCDPNCQVDVQALQIVAIRAIKPAEELSFFYPSTEWDMASGFHCWCGSTRCVGEVRGARWLQAGDFTGRLMARHILELRAGAWQNPPGTHDATLRRS